MNVLEETVSEIQEGNDALRERVLVSYQPFIHKYASFICKKKLDWAHDDELSIALIAFNKAIDGYRARRGSAFTAYARAVMKNSLIDYFKKQPQYLLLDEKRVDAVPQSLSKDARWAVDDYANELENRDRAFEIELLKEELCQFGLSLKEMPAVSPRHRATREYLKSVAQQISSHEQIVRKLNRNKRLPSKEIQAYTGANRKTLEKWRKYLVSLIIILTHPDLGILTDYVWGKEA